MKEEIYTINYILENKIDKKYYGFIYITTNITNSKKYIGRRKFDKKQRWEKYIGSGKILLKAIKIYGKENFKRDIIAIAYSESELNQLEKLWIINHEAVNNENYYNIAEGGYCNPWILKTEEEIIKIKESISNTLKGKYLGNKNPMYGKKLSESSKEKIRLYRKTQVFSEESKIKRSTSLKKVVHTENWNKKIGEAQKGDKHWNYGKHLSNEHKKKIGAGNKGKIVTEETRKKLSLAMKGKKNSEETRRKISMSLKGRKLTEKTINKIIKAHNIKVICTINKKIYDSIKDASEYYKVIPSHISACCKGKRKSAGKHPETGEKLTWMYYDDYIQNNEHIQPYINNSGKNRQRKIIQLSLEGKFIQEWDSLIKAETELGIGYTKISSCCRGKQKTTGGFKWMYKEDWEEKQSQIPLKEPF